MNSNKTLCQNLFLGSCLHNFVTIFTLLYPSCFKKVYLIITILQVKYVCVNGWFLIFVPQLHCGRGWLGRRLLIFSK